MTKRFYLTCCALLLTANAFAGGWYVGNTSPTEWIRYKRVWLSDGAYRFTARAGASSANASLHLEINNATVLAGVPVPNFGRPDSFTNVHLGRATLAQGYYDLKIVFDAGNISLDWFMLSKDADTSSSVKTADVTMVRPDTSGMLVAPITAFSHKSGTSGLASAICSQPGNDINGQPYNDAQIRTWYSIPMYADYDRRIDRYWDILIDDLISSRAQVPIVHCRETKDFTRGLQDRDYAEGPGAFEGRWLLKFSEAVGRNSQAVSALKIGMFWESGGIADGFKQRNGYFPAWKDPLLVDYVMDYWLCPWFDNIPASLLYYPLPSRPIISFFSNHPTNMVKDGGMGDFLGAVRTRLQEKYGYNPLFLLPTGGDVDAAALAQAWGQVPWVTWDGPLLETNRFGGSLWGTTMVGSRRRLDTVWMNDWNPLTNTGTPNTQDQNGHDSFQSRLNSSGNSVLIDSLTQAHSLGIKLVQQEGFTNVAEGNSIFRSYHPGWSFPNQHLAAMREFSDPASQTFKFEAEGCDDYSKTVNDGNSGGSFRREWYSGGNNLDVYKPLSNLQSWIARNSGPGNLSQISAGFYDTWALGSDGKVWAQPIMAGQNTWTQVTSAPAGLTQLSVGKEYVWALKGSTVYSTKTPYGWNYWTSTGWTQRSGSMVHLSAATSEVWGVNASKQVFHRPADGTADWTAVSGTMDKVYAGDQFVWGIQGPDIYFTRASSIAWTQVTNPNSITQLAVGSEEVWGINAAGQIFRRSISGVGGWDSMTNPGGTLTSFSVGDGYAWGLVGTTPYYRRLEGFLGADRLAPLIPRAVAGNGNVVLSWTGVSSATGYNVKRATSGSGPYANIASNVMPFTTSLSWTDSTVANGTTCYYVISAVTPTGETGNSPWISVTPQSQTPAAPTNLTASSGFGNQVTVNWSDPATTEDGFRIERRTGSGAYVPIGAVSKNTKSYIDTVFTGPTYTYRVRAFNAAGPSAYSNEFSCSTLQNRLSRSGWVATASTSAGGSPANALDGNIGTRWGTGGPQVPGQWFQLDLSRVNKIYEIDLDIVNSDYPRGYELYLSLDGLNWGSPVANGAGSSILTTITFAPERARYIRIVQTGSTTGTWFGIYEINVSGQPADDLSRTGWNLTASSSETGGLPASSIDGSISTRWSTGASQVSGQWFNVDLGATNTICEVTLDAGSSANDYPRGYQLNVSNDGVNWGTVAATGTGASSLTTIHLVPITARYLRITLTASTANFWSIHELRVAGTPSVSVSRSGWIATASVAGTSSPVLNALDSNLSTRWSTGVAQVDGQWFQLDLGTLRSFRQIVLDAGSSTNDYPRGYQIYVSSDGVNWGSFVAAGAGFSTISTIYVPPQSTRYLRIVQTGSTGGTWWSIHEVNLF